jgi:hypothetical protein
MKTDDQIGPLFEKSEMTHGKTEETSAADTIFGCDMFIFDSR